jgi:uncharacterized protein with PIN domain
MSAEPAARHSFIVDRMLGTLSRYLRFMGYDTISANSLREGNRKEDTLLLTRAEKEGRILLTRDRELARRGGERAVLIHDENVIPQVRQLARLGLIEPELRMNRCSLCNAVLRPARQDEICGTSYAPAKKESLEFFWCKNCRKLYWMGSHGSSLSRRLKEGLKDE